jgi:hypothetical protein
VATVGTFTERIRSKRREERKNWTVEDERQWLEDHPDDEPLEGYEAAKEPPNVDHDTDLVPDIEPYEPSPEEEAIDAVLDRITIIEAYNRWCDKGTVQNKNGRTESIKVRCPNPAHADHNPSAWLNTEKEVWVCAGCGMEGGDKYDIAAWGLGFPVPGYKSTQFPDLRRAMAVDLGYVVTTNRANKTETVAKEDAPATAGEPSSSDEDDTQPIATVTPLQPSIEPEVNPILKEYIKIDWRTLLPEDRFLRSYMEATTVDDLPEEYHFWNAMVALGATVGRDVYLQDYSNVLANIFVTTVGGTGTGKSRSAVALTKLLREAVPYDALDESNTGVQIVQGVGSGEALIDQFVKIYDDGTGTKHRVPVRGMVQFDELSSLIGKSAQKGSILKPTLMSFYDGAQVISAASRGAGEARAEQPYACCISTTQRDSLRDLLSRSDASAGFINRWVFSMGIPKQPSAYGGQVIDLTEPVKQLKGVKSWASFNGPLAMVLSGDALDLWTKFFYETIAPLTVEGYLPPDPDDDWDDDDKLNPILSRLSLTFKKLILLFAIDNKEASPSVASVERALALWPYMQATYQQVGVKLFVTELDELEERVLLYIHRRTENGSPPTRKEVHGAVKRKYSSEDLHRVLRYLEELDTIEYVTVRTRGRPKTVIRLVGEPPTVRLT